jgi:hypothetical protein
MHHLRLLLAVICCGLFLSQPQSASAQAKPDKRLLQKVSIKADARPIDEFLKELGEKNKLPVDFDPSIAKDGAEKLPFTLTADGITLGSVINLACEACGFVSTIEKGRLLVAMRISNEETVRDYPLAPLGGNVDLRTLSTGVVELTSCPWESGDFKGGAIVQASPDSLKIRQNRAGHAEVQALFELLSNAASGKARALTPQDRAEQAITRKLQAPSQVASAETELPELLNQLLKKNGIPFWIDETALSDESIDWKKLSSTPDAKKMPASKRLDAIAEEHKLSWRIADEVVQITSATKGDETMFCRIYDVSHLMRPLPVVMQEFTSNKDLGKWAIDDGVGGELMPFGTSLVIRQNAKAHAKIAKLLN